MSGLFMNSWIYVFEAKSSSLREVEEQFIHTYIHTYIHIYIHIYMHACMHVYTHTYTLLKCQVSFIKP